MRARWRDVALAWSVIVCAIPAKAGEMGVAEAQRFVAGKHFYYTCFEGTTGHGHIDSDGSAAGYIQIGRSGKRHYVALPAGALRIRGDHYCLSIRGIAFEPCFNVERTGHDSFRGSVAGFGFAYCNFTASVAAGAGLFHWPLRLRRIRAESEP